MDYNFFIFLIALSISLYLLSRLIRSSWVALSLGWIAGGILIILGYLIAEGEAINSVIVFDVDSVVRVPVELGISSENTFIIFLLLGLVMIFSSSGDWI